MHYRILLLVFLLFGSLCAAADVPNRSGSFFQVAQVGSASGQRIYEVEFLSASKTVDVEIASRLVKTVANSRNYEPTGDVQVADGASAMRKLFVVNIKKREDPLPQFLEIKGLFYLKTAKGKEAFVIECEHGISPELPVESAATVEHREEIATLLEQLCRRGAISKLRHQLSKQGSNRIVYQN